MNGENEEFDCIIYCTGYKIDLPFLSDEIQDVVLDKETNNIKVFSKYNVGNDYMSCNKLIHCKTKTKAEQM